MTSTAAPAADFSCAICLDTATEPVVTRCGHLFCWECLDHWLHSAAGAPECPVCKGRVDEHMAGDIIPLYGKGRQTAGKPGGRAQAASTATAAAAAATATGAATEAAAVDRGQEEFFRRPSAYSFAPARDARRTSASTAGAPNQPGSQDEHHPRPSADRAPPRPRPPQQQQHPNVQMHMHTHGMPLTVGSSVFFFGGGGGMFFSIILIMAWALYNYAPWREWRGDVVRWYHRARGNPVPEERTGNERHDTEAATPANADAPRPSATANNNNSSASQAAASGEAAGGLPSQQVMVRNLVFSVLAVFVLFQLLISL